MNAKIRNTLFACFVSMNIFSQQIVSGEYFFDIATALGGGTAFTVTSSTNVNHSMTIPTSSLSAGFHNLFIRVKNNLNIWSHYEGRMVYIMPTQILTTPNLVSGEYFVDTDPGLGNGTAISFTSGTNVSPSLTVPTASLASGIHNLFIRVKNSAGKWSHYEGRMFYIMQTITASLPNIVSGEYFMDTDPGLGNGTAISFTAATTVNPIVNINTTSLTSGFHNLFIRVKNSAGKWSHYEGRLFYVMPSVPSSTPTILNGEYFVDTDPGLGNGTAISFTSGTNVSPIINVNTTSLAAGNHNLFIRVKNSSGKWSHYEGRAFFICANALATSVISGNTSYCAGQTIVLNGTSVPNATSYLWTGPNGFTANGLTMQRTNSTVAMSGNYVLKAIRAGGTLCDTSTISYAVIVNPTYTTNNPQTICQGESYTFNGNSYTTAGNYPSVLQSITGCDSTVVTQLTVRPTYTTNNPQTICQGESYTYNGNTYTTSGNYPTLLQSIYGCDSTVVTQLTVRPNYTTNNPQSICQGGSYSIGGNTYTAEGTYSDLLQSIYGCDSIVTTVITFTPVQLNLNVTTSGLSISSAQNAGSYQWINCANDAPISGANSQNFTATANGSYAVILTECGVSDTSNCVVINDVGLDENDLNFNVQLYPNPTEDILTIEVFGANLKQLFVTDLNGKILSKQQAFGNTNNLNVKNLSTGVYLVNIETEYGVLVRRFVKK
jgi:hypothetical protein